MWSLLTAFSPPMILVHQENQTLVPPKNCREEPIHPDIFEVFGAKPIDAANMQVCKRKGGQRAVLHSNGGRIWQDALSRQSSRWVNTKAPGHWCHGTYGTVVALHCPAENRWSTEKVATTISCRSSILEGVVRVVGVVGVVTCQSESFEKPTLTQELCNM